MDALLTEKDVAAALKLSVAQVQRLSREGVLPYMFLGNGRIRRYRPEDVNAAVNARFALTANSA